MPAQKIFIACPIGADGSPERERSDQLLEFVVASAAEQFGYDVIRADKIGEPGRITHQIARELGSSDLVIADLTGSNANVMYEVGVRQALGRPLVLMAQKGQPLPFDLMDFRTIFYELSLAGAKEARKELAEHIAAIREGREGVVSRALFGISEPNQVEPTSADSQVLSAVYGTYERLVRESEEARELLLGIRLQVGALVEAHQQAMAMQLMSTFLEQGFQDPEKLQKFMSVVQTFQPDSEAVKPAPPHSQEGQRQTPPQQNRRKRRK